MSGPLDLARPELVSLRPYLAGAFEPDCIRMNANESPWRAPGDKTERGLNRYPPPRPVALRARLAAHYGVNERELLVTRGSSEAIDILIRGFCAAGRDRILVCPPTFDMYRVYASIQGAGVIEVPLRRDRGFALNADAVAAAVDESTKIVFLCSPNNPTGHSLRREDVERIADALQGRTLLVIDEAYYEFSSAGHYLDLRKRHRHVVLLRTLSKFVSLAGVRCGALIADDEVVQFLQNVLPPYTFPTPSIELVLKAFSEGSLEVSTERVALLKRERARLSEALRDVPHVLKVWPSDANFILVETRNGTQFHGLARAAGILVRLFPDQPALQDCVRITIGSPEDNDRLLTALSGAAGAGHA